MALTRFPSNPNAYDILGRISNGNPTVAVVYKALCLASETIVAIKIINCSPTAAQLRAVNTLTRSHAIPPRSNILKPHCLFIVGDKLWVVMPYVAGGSLRAIMNCRHPHGVSPECISAILMYVIGALETFHDRGIAHNGVKPGNILLDRDGSVKLSDFGVSSWNYENEWTHNLGYTDIPPYWMPPEVWAMRLGIGTVSDIWSLGVTALELFHGRPPFTHFPESISLEPDILRRFHYSQHYKKGKGPMHRECPIMMANFISKCINAFHPTARPSAEALLDHGFFNDDHLPFNPPGHLADQIVNGILRDEDDYWAGVVKGRLINEANNDFADGNVSGRTFRGWIFRTTTIEMEPVFEGDRVLIGGCRSTARDKRVRLSEEDLEECATS